MPQLQNDFDRCLHAASAHVFASHHGELSPLIATVAGLPGEAERRDLAWARHAEWMQHRFQNEPVFSPGETVTTPLSAVYLRLRCYWHEKIIDADNDDERNQKNSLDSTSGRPA